MINEEIISYFESIFKARPPPNAPIGEPFLEMVRDALPSNAPYLTAPITTFDIKTELDRTKTGKSPGTDGIPYEFYVLFWDVIAPHFLDMFKHVLERDSLSPSQGRAAVRLIPKSNGVCGVSGYRPISLLNTDYKLMASVLASRLRKSLGEVIRPYQKGGVPGRLLFDNLCLYRDVIQYVEERTGRERVGSLLPTSSKAGIIGVDLAKAYDLVNRDVLWEIMGVMGYPGVFISWLRTMYSVADMTVLNGVEEAGSVTGVQSVRQGCPLSMHLFVIYIEPLLVRLANSIGGIKFLNQSVSVRAMVDDIVIFVSEDTDIIKAGEILDLFCEWTKAMMNKQKTKILGIGGWTGRSQWPLPWLESTTNLKLLGIPFSTSISETATKVWDSVYGHMLGLVRDNSSRRLTLYQRVIVLKTRILSRAVYIASVLPCPEAMSESMLSLCVRFVYNGINVEKPSRCVSFRSPSEGGLSLPHPGLFFKALFLKNIYNTLVLGEPSQSHLLRFWTGFPLRRHLPHIYQGNMTPTAVIERPGYLQEPVCQIAMLLDQNIVSPSRRLPHRAVYQHWLQPHCGPGKVEELYPNLDWNSIWRQTSKLRTDVRDIMFLFNHRLLATGERCHRLKMSPTATCNFCQQADESDEHLLLHCPERQNIATWLEGKIRQHGCNTPPIEYIRGHLGPVRSTRKLFALIAAYVYTTWKARTPRLRIPTEDEVEKLWQQLYPKETP